MNVLLVALALIQSSCAPEPAFLAHLLEKYGEYPFLRGTYGEGTATDKLLLGNFETGTWTELRVTNGIACVVSAGRSLTILDPPEKKKGKEL